MTLTNHLIEGSIRSVRTSVYILRPRTSSELSIRYRSSAQTIIISEFISKPGIFLNRNREEAVENVAIFAHRSLPCRSSLYARTEASSVSPTVENPSSSIVGLVLIILMKVFIFPKLIIYTFQSRSSLRSRFTVFQTC